MIIFFSLTFLYHLFYFSSLDIPCLPSHSLSNGLLDIGYFLMSFIYPINCPPNTRMRISRTMTAATPITDTV